MTKWLDCLPAIARGKRDILLFALWIAAVLYIYRTNMADNSLSAWLLAGMAYTGLAQRQSTALKTVAKTVAAPVIGESSDAARGFSNSVYFDHALAVAVPVLLMMALYLPSLNLWFAIDDPCHLGFVKNNGLWSSFYDPTRQISWANFTPFFVSSFGADYLWFGQEPRGFYAHQLLALMASLVALYALLLRFLSPLAASTLLSAFSVSTTATTFATQLMTRHYVEGLLFAALSALAFWRAAQPGATQPWRWALGGAVLYLIASLHKELYTPLVGVILFFPLGTWQQRLRLAIPFFIAAALYITWRFAMQGGAVSAYTASQPTGLRQTLSSFITSYADLLHWTAAHGWLLALLAGLGCWAVLRHPLTRLPLAVVITGAVLLPIMPVMLTLADRYVLLLSLLLYGFAGLGLDAVGKTASRGGKWTFTAILAPLLGGSLILTGFYASQSNLEQLWSSRVRNDAEGRFMLHNQALGSCLLTSEFLCLWGYYQLRNRDVTPFFSPSPCFTTTPEQSLFAYEDNQLRQVSAAPCGPIDNTLPLRLDLKISGTLIQWQFGPWEHGRYVFVIEEVGAFALPRIGQTGRFVLRDDPPLHFRLWYENEAGQRTFSDAFELNTTQEQHIVWERGG